MNNPLAPWFTYNAATKEEQWLMLGAIQTLVYRAVMQGNDNVDEFVKRATATGQYEIHADGVKLMAERVKAFVAYLDTGNSSEFSSRRTYTLAQVCFTVLPHAPVEKLMSTGRITMDEAFWQNMGAMYVESCNTRLPVFGRDARYVQMTRIDHWCKSLPPLVAELGEHDDGTVFFKISEDE